MNNTLYERYPELAPCKEAIEKTVDIMAKAYTDGGKILLCGNGGSCADCDHIVGELLKGFLKMRPMTEQQKCNFENALGEQAERFEKTLQQGIPAVALHSQTGALTAFANDVDPDMIYAQMTFALGKKNDVAVGISTSGNSGNVINALKCAKAMGLKTVGLCGARECKMDEVCDVVIKAPETETFKIQEYHLPIYHEICAALEARFFDK